MSAHDPKDVAGRIGRMVGLDRPALPSGVQPLAAQMRMRDEGLRIAGIKAGAALPADMLAAPVAPARGAVALQPLYERVGGGMRRRVGAHFRAVCALEAAVIAARARHEARGIEAAFVPPYTLAQIATAGEYRALVEWREGSMIKCASLEPGRSGGGGQGSFIETYVREGNRLAAYQVLIGDGVAMDIRRHIDRGGKRRRITVRAAVDMIVLAGLDVKTILRRFGWDDNGAHIKVLRAAIGAGLDRMQLYRPPVATK